MSENTISASELVDKLSVRLGKEMTKAKIKEVMDALSSQVRDDLASGASKITVGNLAIIQTKDRAARKGRNPRTGEEITIPAATVISMKPTKGIRDAVGGDDSDE